MSQKTIVLGQNSSQYRCRTFAIQSLALVRALQKAAASGIQLAAIAGGNFAVHLEKYLEINMAKQQRRENERERVPGERKRPGNPEQEEPRHGQRRDEDERRPEWEKDQER